MSPKHTLPAFELSVLAALAFIGWASYELEGLVPAVDDTSKELAEVRDDCFALADSVRTNLAELELILANAPKSKNSAEQFHSQASAWTGWLEDQRNHWARPQEFSQATNSTGYLAAGSGQFNLPGNRALPLLRAVLRAQTNYLKAGEYLIRNTTGLWIEKQVALHETELQSARSRLLRLSGGTCSIGEGVSVFIRDMKTQSAATAEYYLHLRWGLLIAIVFSCLLVITEIYRGKMAQTRAVLRNHAQQQLDEQRSRLDKLVNFGRLAQEVVHEIKQPLTTMNARAFTLQKGVSPDSDAFRDAVVIRSEVKRLDRIVKHFLLLAKPTEPRLADLRAADALAEVRNLMAPHLAHDSIEFKFDCDDRLRFRADLAQITQVLINLIKNAAECLAPRGGSVTLRAKAATEDRAGKATEVAVIEVEDTGPGIPIELQEKIFEPFFSTKGDGTGLGLAIATRIVDKHGGRLELDTEPGRGTVFRIILPACSNHQTS